MKNLYCRCGSLISIDDEDFDKLSRYNWTCNKRFCVYTYVNTKATSLTAFLFPNLDDGLEIDHKDHNIHNCTKLNLRSATRQQQCCNRRKYKSNTSGYKGVTYIDHMGKWRSTITYGGKKKHLGCFDSKHEAALAYNIAAIKYHGEFASLNQI